MMDDLVGTTINNFEIQERLGGGGMGIVYRAHHPILGLDVAVKIMRPELVSQEGFYQRFLREAQAIARLQHPGIVRVTNFGQHEGIAYLMMDLIAGPTLRELLRDFPFGLPLETALRLTQLLAEALAYAHSKGVLHLDLKPDNILLDPDRSSTPAIDPHCPYWPVINDFGLARLKAGPDISIHTSQRIGTPHYMSPEQCLGKPITEQSDVYSLGIMLYEVLTGQRPFAINTLVQAVHFHGTQMPEPPSSHLSGLPPGVDDLVMRLLAKQAEQRPTASEVAQQLEAILASSTPVPPVEVAPVRDGTVVTPPESESWPSVRASIGIEVVYRGQHIDRYPMNRDVILVGRLPSCDLHLESSDKVISKRHCEIRWQNGEMVVRDLHSTNKTYLDDVQLTPDLFYPWPQEAPLRLGMFTLTWSTIEPPDLSDTHALHEIALPAEEERALRIECESGRPKVLELNRDSIIIGRLPSCDLVIADPGVSKRHCRVHRKGDQVEVQDLNSTNGTQLGDAQLKSGQLYLWDPGTDLHIGPYTLRLLATTGTDG